MNQLQWVNIAGVSLHLPNNIAASNIVVRGNLYKVIIYRTDSTYLRLAIYGNGCDDFQNKLLALAGAAQLLTY